MENTGETLFNDDVARWYVALGEKWVGPLKAEDVYKKIIDREISWAHYVWKAGQTEWTRICDTPDYAAVVPAQPKIKPQVIQAKTAAERNISQRTSTAQPPAAPRAPSDKVWFIYAKQVQSGPFSEAEVKESFATGKVSGRIHLWRDGMGQWETVDNLPTFAKVYADSEKANSPAPKAEQRVGQRRPLVARIFISNDRDLAVGVCRDISIGGMQVLTDHIPGAIGTQVKMNVSPAEVESGGEKIEPFVAHGQIVRLLEDGRGFSFRFEKISEQAKRVIEDFIRE
jgi:hypothetical protein